jgi:S1-C subfamily serine protease
MNYSIPPILKFCTSFICLALLLSQCASPPAVADTRAPDINNLAYANARACAIVVTGNADLQPWIRNGFAKNQAPKDGEAGTACPITNDGYFLTADHVIRAHKDRHIHIMYGRGTQLRMGKGRVVWRDTYSDLALIHSPIETPLFYQFAPPQRGIANGTSIFHGGLSTGLKPMYGQLSDTISAQNFFTSPMRFRMNIPLRPGDSGGPILDCESRLIGVNSSVEFLVPMETAIFTESQGSRPNILHLMKTIQRDRRK